MKEADLSREIQIALSARGHRVFRNNVGMGWAGTLAAGYPKNGSVLLLNARPLHAGLATGSHDLIGIAWGGRFLSIEVKLPGKKTTKQQNNWLDMVQRVGGRAGVARSIEDAIRIAEEG